ncbi:PepSY-associated TM helix domain-containing protein [Anaerospora hongkongensis]|uniref:PepSY-associated TM helix domain-containing protein n=1 Tax=Anaerospora hongkongensis TaxID=244830 RepID=UPI003A523658
MSKANSSSLRKEDRFMYIAVRKLHQWVGLILAVFLLIEAITGLILAEPWLVGQSRINPPHSIEGASNMAQRSDGMSRSSSPLGIAKQLHEGKLNGLNFKWLIDLTAIGIILLTVTGIHLSISLLFIRNKQTQK